jgi:hypothetical protein
MNPNEGYIHCSNNTLENMLRTHWEQGKNPQKTPKETFKKLFKIYINKFIKLKKK